MSDDLKAEMIRLRAALSEIVALAGPVNASDPARRLDAIVGRARQALDGSRS